MDPKLKLCSFSSLAHTPTLIGACGIVLLSAIACASSKTQREPGHAQPVQSKQTETEFASASASGAPMLEGAVGAGAVPMDNLVAKNKRSKASLPAAGLTPALTPAASPSEAVMDNDESGWASQMTPEFNTEAYDPIFENRFVSVQSAPLSTFSVDVDTASYSNMRRYLQQGMLPPKGAVRIEELVNYFDYPYEQPTGDQPFYVHTELSTAPWAEDHKLLHIGLQGKFIEQTRLPARNLVFLLDVSGSMNDENKLPLLKRSLTALLDTMGERDTVSIVVYAGASGMVLPPTSAQKRGVIISALEQLEAGGSTNGGEGIELAYRLAERSFQPGGVNRVILATDGDFNVGTTDQSSLVNLIERKRESGVFLTVLGFGMGNYKDSTLENLADHGNGNYAYIDSFSEARKVLVEEGGANLVTIAKDVKIQVEMNPTVVGAYRLIGYENRVLEAEDFNDDKKDAGDIGAGHTVTALYEIMSPEQAAQELDIDPLKYKSSSHGAQRRNVEDHGWNRAKTDRITHVDQRVDGAQGASLATVKLRFKSPQGNRSSKAEYVVNNRVLVPSATSTTFRFSAAVASFGMLLRGSEYRGHSSFGMVQQLAASAMDNDEYGHRREFLNIVEQASRL